MSVVYLVTFSLLVLAGLFALIRLVRGPRTLDRVLAIDVLVVLIVAGVAVEMAMTGQGMNLSLLVAVALLGFVGSASVVRLAEAKEGRR
ncbi:monovalent cation/H+ antiporter complex subunit F [Amycolatopsis sp. CA-230715]|uniref:monovalent cation/H+ antiporter complex subunit F n=1 Tax=Amycolatopsis sp. CA-230715 TaxID=2745196 RepID=UPI001C021178|nr:monovalent cation/H+ antiporter complex subunit F [Amycolatopsis sp. CA-230715]QWF83680.1 hypothetical protein HUW46_07123 [Amycolatopsis sp. CA-230715]